MKFICVQPDSNYYLWQCKVLLNNFRRLGIEQDAILLFCYYHQVSTELKELQGKTTARIHFYQDDRIDKSYIPSIRPCLLKQFYSENLWLEQEDVLYHDCDIVFRKLPDFDLMKESKLYLSDTISYIGSKYIISKSQELFERMCLVVGVDPALVDNNHNNSGGAQYFFKKGLIDYQYWDKVERDCIALYALMRSTESIYSPHHPIQSWCSDMFSVLWNALQKGMQCEVHKELSFCWPTDRINAWDGVKIYHNAGVSGDRKELFWKAGYINVNPLGEDLSYVSKDFCSFKYVEEIESTKQSGW